MGRNYSLCLICQRDDSKLLLTALSELLDYKSRQRIDLMQWSPELETERITIIGTSEIDARGISGLNLCDYEHPNYYCFALQIPLEPEMEFLSDGALGCMYTSVFAGAQYLLLELTAATSDLSWIIQKSSAVHAAWTLLAIKTNAIFGYVDIEEDVAIQLYPKYGDLILPDPDDETLIYDGDGGYRFVIDRMVEYLISTNS
jgi:hypothetical protein